NNTNTEVSVDDRASAWTTTYAVDASTVGYGGGSLLHYSGLRDLALHGSGSQGGTNGDEFTIESTSASDATSVYTAADNAITICPTSHDLDGIGNLTISAGGGNATLTIDDQGTPGVFTYPGTTTYTFDAPTLTRQAVYRRFIWGKPIEFTQTA